MAVPERRIELNAWDVDAWNMLLRESANRPIDQTRPFYERLVAQFPTAGKYWKAYIEQELRAKNFENVEKLFGKCLISVLHIDLWKCYVHYVRETKGHMPSFREKMAQAYDFALERVGMDLHAHTIYADYINFLKGVPAAGQYAENQRIMAVRKIYQRAVQTPMLGIEHIWADYCAYEKGINPVLAEKLINERQREYQRTRQLSRQLEQLMRGLNRSAVSTPLRLSASEQKQVEQWRAYIDWEQSNPLETNDFMTYARRVAFAYEQVLLCLGFHADVWCEAAAFQQATAKELTERGDAKAAATAQDEVARLFERASVGPMADCALVYFAWADFEESRMQIDKARQVLDKLVLRQHVDPTLAYCEMMKAARRSEGMAQARQVFRRAREDARSRFHVYVCAALIEYFCTKDANIALRVFDLGLKKYGDEPEFALAYVDFLSHINEDNNTRVVFERILTSGQMSAERAIPIWDRYLEFETRVGDLNSTAKVEKRRREALVALATGPGGGGASSGGAQAGGDGNDGQSATQQSNTHQQPHNRHALIARAKEKLPPGVTETQLLIDRYAFYGLLPATETQLRLIGYQKRDTGSSNVVATALPVTVDAKQSTGNGTGSSAGTGSSVGPTTSSGLVPHGASLVMGGEIGAAFTAFARPDTSQMIAFKPATQSSAPFHVVPGGLMALPPSAAQLLTLLPPPSSFAGPFVVVDKLVELIRNFEWKPVALRPDGSASPSRPTQALPNGTTFGALRMEDVRKDMYTLLATTADPAVAIGMAATSDMADGGSSLAGRKRAASPDDGLSRDGSGGGGGGGGGDIYKRRMQAAAAAASSSVTTQATSAP